VRESAGPQGSFSVAEKIVDWTSHAIDRDLATGSSRR
jgi:hypothetical protein